MPATKGPDAHFDVVSTIEVLEHVRDVDMAMSEIVRVLKPGGALLVSVPNRYFPFETHLVKFGRRQVAGARHRMGHAPFRRLDAGRRFVRPLTDRLEKSPLRVMGVSIPTHRVRS